MKLNTFKNILSGFALGLLLVGTTSCEDYLDKAPESDISSADAFKNFTNFQGYTEELYACMPDFVKRYWTGSWNWGEDEILYEGCDYHVSYRFDQGNFWGWQNDGSGGWNAGWMDLPEGQYGTSVTGGQPEARFCKALWPLSWYGIRKCNMGLENLDKLTDATQEEKDIIAGQLYFFRGWFHFELFQFFGGLPYIDKVLGNDAFDNPRESYRSNADKAAADFRKAADLLPIDWEKTTVGQTTAGRNGLRVNKIAALAYLGKNYLWAASPLMAGETSDNKYNYNRSTYDYDTDYAKKAAAAFDELLELVEHNKTQYSLVPFDKISDVFYTIDRNHLTPGSTEAIWRTGTDGWNGTNWGISKQFGTTYYGSGNAFSQPCANYVNYAYGMANGEPAYVVEGGKLVVNTASGFDETHPWKDRDPRFYSDIVYDGVKMFTDAKVTAKNADLQYAPLGSDSRIRNAVTGSRTGYLLYKFIDISCNQYDLGWDYAHGFHINVPWLRLSDVYLMYAEAKAAAGDLNGSGTCGLNAIQAVNKIRARAGVADFSSKYTGSKDKFLDELRRERAVELAYEGHRFNDLRRWLLLDKKPYTIKTSQEFTRVGDLDTSDPKVNEVKDFSEKEILTRDFSSKHYWLPLKISDVSIYPELYQNPGW